MNEKVLIEAIKAVLLYIFIIVGCFALFWKVLGIDQVSVGVVAGTLGGIMLGKFLLSNSEDSDKT